MKIAQFDTVGYNGYAVQFSPYFKDRLACASSANYGIVGNGKLWIIDIIREGQLPTNSFAPSLPGQSPATMRPAAM